MSINTSNILYLAGFFILVFLDRCGYPRWFVWGLAIVGLEFDQALASGNFLSWWIRPDTFYDLAGGFVGLFLALALYELFEGILNS
jgi:hypothetical protein